MNYFKYYTEALGNNLKSIEDITNFTNNTDVIGLYAEKLVINFIRKSIGNLNISTGAVISPEDFNVTKALPQIDVIIWDSNPLPAIFDLDDCALVPRNSVFAILEVKKTDYYKGLKDIKDRFDSRDKILPEHCKDFFFSIICVVDKHKVDGNNILMELIKHTGNKTQYLLNFDSETNKIEINNKGVLEFINFLGQVRKLHKETGSEFVIDLNKTGL